jgi:hypothetical protein
VSYWYIAHDDELLIDLDNCKQPLRSTGGRLTHGEVYFGHRLMDAEQQGLVKLAGAWLVPSSTPGRYHAYVQLAQPMTLGQRLAWQSWLGGDWMRSRADFMRRERGIEFPSILEEPAAIRQFYREADYVCACEGKHKSEDQAALPIEQQCEVWRKLRGASVWDLFGKWEKPENLPALPMVEGRLPLERWRQIRRHHSIARRKQA